MSVIPAPIQDLHHHPFPQKTKDHNDYRPVTLTSVIMKSSECLMLDNSWITYSLPTEQTGL